MSITEVAREVQRILQAYKSLQDIIAILGMDELSEEDKLTVARARKYKDSYQICKGEYDHLPEAAFYMVGSIEEVVEKAEKIRKRLLKYNVRRIQN